MIVFLTLNPTMPAFNDPGKKSYENIVVKGVNAGGKQRFLSFVHNIISSLLNTEITIRASFNLSSANALNLVSHYILSSCKE